AVLEEMDYVAFHRRRRITDNGAAVFATLESIVAKLAVFRIDMLEERHRDVLLPGTEHRERELLRLLYQVMGSRIRFDADHHQRRLKARLGGPIDRRYGLFVTLAGAQHLE